MRPKVLLATTCRWVATARLAMAMTDAGFVVEVVCPSGHPVAKVSAAPGTYAYRGALPVRSIRSAMLQARPDLVIPCDDLATKLLHSICERESLNQPAESWTAALLARSLGDPGGYAVAGSRSRLIALAETEGLRVPKTSPVENTRQLDRWLGENGLPAVLKTNGTSGGLGVRVVTTPAEAHRAFADLNAPPLAARVAKRAIIDRDINLLIPFLVRRRPVINIQAFVRGYDATSAIACWDGKVLASILFEVVHTWNHKGPASVVRIVENPEMLHAAKTIAGKLKLSGLYGFDFMIERETGNAFLIEMNPRATQTCHLPLGAGHDLPAALWSVLSGEPAHETKSVTDKKEIALFPLEWQRNPASRFLMTAYLDVPWQEPELIRDCVRSQPEFAAWPMKGLEQFYCKLPGLRGAGLRNARQREDARIWR